MLIQIHTLQNYSPANLNRDDTGSPKDAMFGGYLRGRISSQCLKRAMRRSMFFDEAFKDKGLLATRTKQLHELIIKGLQTLGATEAEQKAIVERVREIGKKAKKPNENEGEANEAASSAEETKDEGTSQLIFIAPNETQPMAEKLLKAYRADPKKWAKVELKSVLGTSTPRSVDIALFGRMTTDEAFEDVKAASQVAHALSTHAIKQEFDYYTAVDDLTLSSGAGMIGDVEFNSATYYKYLNVHFDKLQENLGGDEAAKTTAREAVLAVLEAGIFAQPTGKQNAFAAHNLPDFVLVEVSDRNLPVNYANAFQDPVKTGQKESLMFASISRLIEHAETLGTKFGLKAQRAYLSTAAKAADGWSEQPTLEELRAWLGERLGV